MFINYLLEYNVYFMLSSVMKVKFVQVNTKINTSVEVMTKIFRTGLPRQYLSQSLNSRLQFMLSVHYNFFFVFLLLLL